MVQPKCISAVTICYIKAKLGRFYVECTALYKKKYGCLVCMAYQQLNLDDLNF